MNFSDQNKLGEGGFGVVYKGVLEDGQVIAVKKLVTNSGQGIGELKNEVALVAKLQHRNLVRLMGYCLQAQEKLLVYEYLPNKSLEKFLFDPFRSKELTWEMRLKIIEGIGRGLLYLHEDSRLKIVHRDLKASNILLDERMNPKIADFGLARLFDNEQSYGNTNQIAGTHGYMAPEYVMQGQISTKSDVYSFGVLLLEIVTGKRCAGYYGSDPPTDLISYIWRHWEEGNPIQLLDRGIYEGCSAEEVLRRIHIGLLCVQRDPLERPSMSLVVVMLSSHSTSLPTISPFPCFTDVSTSTSEDPGVTSRPTGIPSMPLPLINDALAINSDITTLEPR
ncbi:unnamed protein product [Spirodela intermedia]|uniref:Protein kinase domain-containing protein n=1 Tax=Spirodela intermedia TaxID=51605 RepID=A0A7I8L6L8_SPIIN|nr:unnamed protein product [Spirodela intermedia]